MYDLKKYQPIHLDDLMRLGRKCDGGYVLSRKQIEKTEVLLSFGICDDWSFETDFLNRKSVVLYAFDNSVSLEYFKKTSKQLFRSMIFRFITGNIAIARNVRQDWLCIKNIVKDFVRFFIKNSNCHFIPKFLGESDSEKYICFDTIFMNLLKLSPPPLLISDFSVFIKMDIESWEYRVLPQLVPFFDKVNGLVVEFHELDIAEKKFEEIMDMLLKQFYVAHIHANNKSGHNSSPLIYSTNLPRVLEITFINKDFISNAIPSSRNYTIKNIDFPCDPTRDDIELHFN
jgi:hypothetical protein